MTIYIYMIYNELPPALQRITTNAPAWPVVAWTPWFFFGCESPYKKPWMDGFTMFYDVLMDGLWIWKLDGDAFWMFLFEDVGKKLQITSNARLTAKAEGEAKISPPRGEISDRLRDRYTRVQLSTCFSSCGLEWTSLRRFMIIIFMIEASAAPQWAPHKPQLSASHLQSWLVNCHRAPGPICHLLCQVFLLTKFFGPKHWKTSHKFSS